MYHQWLEIRKGEVFDPKKFNIDEANKRLIDMAKDLMKKWRLPALSMLYELIHINIWSLLNVNVFFVFIDKRNSWNREQAMPFRRWKTLSPHVGGGNPAYINVSWFTAAADFYFISHFKASVFAFRCLSRAVFLHFFAIQTGNYHHFIPQRSTGYVATDAILQRNQYHFASQPISFCRATDATLRHKTVSVTV